MLNRVILIGRVATEPELRYTQTGVPVTTFRLAVDRPTLTAEQAAKSAIPQSDKQADYIDIVCWRQTAEFAQRNLTKGRLTALEGRLQVREYTSPVGPRKAVEVIAETLRPLDTRPAAETAHNESETE